MWDIQGPGVELIFLALPGRFSTTGPLGKPLGIRFYVPIISFWKMIVVSCVILLKAFWKCAFMWTSYPWVCCLSALGSDVCLSPGSVVMWKPSNAWVQHPRGFAVSSVLSDLVSLFCVSARSHCQGSGYRWAVWVSEEVSHRPRSALQRYSGTVSKKERKRLWIYPISEVKRLAEITFWSSFPFLIISELRYSFFPPYIF